MASRKLPLKRMKPFVTRALQMSPAAIDAAFAPVEDTDLPAVLAFRRPLLDLDDALWWDDEAYLNWRFFDERKRHEGRPSYWGFRRDGELIGGIGLEHVELYLDGQRQPAIRLCDIMISKQLHGLGLGVLINLMLLERFPLVMTLGTNLRSRKMFSKLFTRLEDRQCHKLLATSRELLARRLDGTLLSPAVPIGAVIVDRALQARRLWMRRRSRRLQLERVVRFDRSIDRLSERFAHRGLRFVHRTGDYLNWRYLDCPRARYAGWVLRNPDNAEMLGYVVTRLTPDDDPLVPTVGVLVDWLCDDDEVLPQLLSEAAEQLIGDGAGVVAAWTYGGGAARALKALGFLPRPLEGRPVFVHCADVADPDEVPTRDDRWYFTAGDSDGD